MAWTATVIGVMGSITLVGTLKLYALFLFAYDLRAPKINVKRLLIQEYMLCVWTGQNTA